jgi:hypothetical protein
MVTVSNYAIRQRKDGSSFISLELTGSLELVQSRNSGRFYATVRKCSIPSTFNESVAKSLLGSTLPGQIVRVQVDPYEFTSPTTGEVMVLNHSYSYQPAEEAALVGESKVTEVQVPAFS